MLTDQDKELLREHCTLLLPDTIEHETYQDILYALKTFRAINKEDDLHLYCCSDGGSSSAALAIVDLLRNDGRVVGHLIGDVGSAAATIWAGCPKRVAHEGAVLFVHPVMWNNVDGRSNAHRFGTMQKDLEFTNRQCCAIYASASNKPAEWWEDKLNPAGDGTRFSAWELVIELEMAEWATKTNYQPNTNGYSMSGLVTASPTK